MRLSLVFLNAARRGAAFFVIVEAKSKFSLPSPNGGVDQRKSPSCYARIGSGICSHRILWNVPRVMSAVAEKCRQLIRAPQQLTASFNPG
jgi:hypothetical protein